MFYYLNRLRGTYSYYAKVNAVVIGLIFGLATMDWRIGLAIAIGYIAGESMGWGNWIGQQCGSPLECGNEGEKNGIKWLASKLYTCGTEQYNRLALIVRGFYWWLPTLLPLMFVMNPFAVLVAIVALSMGFQISLDLALSTGKDKWNRAEYIYGGIQDIVIFLLVVSIFYKG